MKSPAIDYIYVEALRLHTMLDRHNWSKRTTQCDADIINTALKKIMEIANALYLFNHPEERNKHENRPQNKQD